MGATVKPQVENLIRLPGRTAPFGRRRLAEEICDCSAHIASTPTELRGRNPLQAPTVFCLTKTGAVRLNLSRARYSVQGYAAERVPESQRCRCGGA